MPPLESSLLEAPVPDSSPPPSRRLVLVPITCDLVAIAAMALIAWWSARLGGNLGPTVISLGATIAACVLAIVVMRLVCPTWKWQRQLVAAVIVGVGLLLSAGAWYGTILTMKMKAYELAWQAVVDRGVPIRPSCTTSAAGYINMPGIGMAYRRCVVLPGPSNGIQVSFLPRSVSSGTGLLYMPAWSDERMRWDECLSHLDGPWWQVGWPNGNCPTGWTFIPGG